MRYNYQITRNARGPWPTGCEYHYSTRMGAKVMIKGFGVDIGQGRFRADLYQNHMVASMIWGSSMATPLI